jgi:molybdopterin-dependent oxidoreductase alpha subunit
MPKIKNYAAGWGALHYSLKFLKRAGFVKGNSTLLRMNQQQGFDCPGCAWPDPKDPSMAEFCENGVKALTFETTKKRANRLLFEKHTVTELDTWDDFELENTGRLTEPLCYNPTNDRYEPIGWDAAFKLIADELNLLSHPDEALFYTSGRTSNEAAFLYQLLVRMLGTNNLPDCSNMCHESSGVGMGESIGIGKGTVSLEDFEHADAIFVMGQNPGTNHPRMLSELQGASQRGAKILSFNPLNEPGLKGFLHPQDIGAMLKNKPTEISSHYYQVSIGGDLAAIRAMTKYIFEREGADGGILDWNFLEEHTSGFEEYRKEVEAENWDQLVEQSGLSKEQIVEAAEVYINAESVICCWAMGLTQHKHGVANIQEVINFLLLKGNIGREGAGACPVRGHSNVQGDRTMGINENPPEGFLNNLERVFGFTAPRKHGYSVVDAIKAMDANKAKFFFGMGGNFAAATPDTELTLRALRKCNLTVQVSTHLNRSHVVHGKKALILPCLGRSEKDVQASGTQSVTVEDSMSMVHASTGLNKPASVLLKSEPAIVAGLATALFTDEPLNWTELVSDYSKIRDKIEAVLPAFAGYNEKIKAPGGFMLYNSARNREWKTATQKARFMANELPDISVKAGQLRLMTIRSHDQYNTTIYDYNDRYRGIKGERRVIFLNRDDAVALHLQETDQVDLASHAADGKVRRAANFRVVYYDIPRGNAAAYFPETNVLVGIDEHAKKSLTPMSKFIPISIKVAALPESF